MDRTAPAPTAVVQVMDHGLLIQSVDVIFPAWHENAGFALVNDATAMVLCEDVRVHPSPIIAAVDALNWADDKADSVKL